MAIFGLDISHHQDERLDLARAKREGIAFIILKATEGSGFTDKEFVGNLREARAAGLLVAAYHYQRSNVSAASQVAHIQRVVPKGVPVIPDVEDNSGGVAMTRDIVKRLRAAGYRVPLLYIPRWYWQQIGSPSLAGLPPLWSSRYPDMVVGDLSDEWADVPAHYWNGYGGISVELLQFTSSVRIAGHYPIDANAYRGSFSQLAALFGTTGGGGAAPGGDDMTPTESRMLRELHELYRKGNHTEGVPQDAGEVLLLIVEMLKRSRRQEGVAAGLLQAVKDLANGREVDLAEVEAAAERGAERGTNTALEEGTVNVDIDVTGPEGKTA